MPWISFGTDGTSQVLAMCGVVPTAATCREGSVGWRILAPAKDEYLHAVWYARGIEEGVRGGGVYSFQMRGRSRMTIDASISTMPGGMEHVGFSPTRQPLPACTKRESTVSEAFVESREG